MSPAELAARIGEIAAGAVINAMATADLPSMGVRHEFGEPLDVLAEEVLKVAALALEVQRGETVIDRKTVAEQISEDTCEKHNTFCCDECFDMTPAMRLVVKHVRAQQ